MKVNVEERLRVMERVRDTRQSGKVKNCVRLDGRDLRGEIRRPYVAIVGQRDERTVERVGISVKDCAYGASHESRMPCDQKFAHGESAAS